MKQSLYSQYVNELCKLFVKKNTKAFDCGCGNGFHTSIIKKYSDSVIGGDFDNRTKKEYNIIFRKIKVNTYGQGEEFDLVTAFDVIEHVEDDLGYLKELIKITKSGGIIIIGTPNRNRLSNKIISLFRGKIKFPRNLGYDYSSGGDILHLREYTSEDLKKLVLNFKNINIIKIEHSFLGIYTPISQIGFKGIDRNILKKYCQHLFMIVQKR